MFMQKSKFFMLAVGLVSGVAIAPLLNPLSAFTATVKQTPQLTEEQREVAAVRSVKPAVVSVIGSKPYAGTTALTDSSFGTGFILTSDGYIISNSHVVEDQNTQYRVVLLDGKSLPARVVGLDRYTDVAVLKVEGQGMATVRFGNSDALETGQAVFAIGNALGKFQHTVTRGVVAGLDRDVLLNNSRPRYQNLIQTDATINPGNSGGPLVNSSGEVIGMNTLVAEGSGLGFAIPSNVVRATAEQLKNLGKANRPYLGVQYVTLNQALAQINSLPVSAGAYVQAVGTNTPASTAGIRVGDILLSINGEVISGTNELDSILSKFSAGSQVLVRINRAGQGVDIPVVLGEYK
jgi:S1-C subfamily serine protease